VYKLASMNTILLAPSRVVACIGARNY